MGEERTVWRVGDPEPESREITLEGRKSVWYRYGGGWRNGLMAPYATISWTALLERDGPLREIRLVGTTWMFADEIPPPTLTSTNAQAARAAGWVPLAEVVDALQDEDRIMAWYRENHPYSCLSVPSMILTADYLTDRLGTKGDRGESGVRQIRCSCGAEMDPRLCHARGLACVSDKATKHVPGCQLPAGHEGDHEWADGRSGTKGSRDADV